MSVLSLHPEIRDAERRPVPARQSRGDGRPRTPPRTASLLDLDAGLAERISESERLTAEDVTAARRELQARVVRLSKGPFELGGGRRQTTVDPGHLGLLLVEGLMARELMAEDAVSLELLGPGDLLRPWQAFADEALLRSEVRWNVLTEVRCAVLDPRATATLARYPEAYAVLVERLTERAHRLAVTQTVCQLNRVDRRLLTMLWHLAGRWGRVTPRGTLLPLSLSHRMLAQLVGARRPTVSTACGELARQGEIVRNPDGTWLLTGEPVGAPDPGTQRYVAPRRRLIQAPAAGPDARGGEGILDRGNGRHDDVLTTLARLAALRDAGVVSPREFATKKRELLSRL